MTNKERREFFIKQSKARIEKLKELNAPKEIIELEKDWLGEITLRAEEDE